MLKRDKFDSNCSFASYAVGFHINALVDVLQQARIIEPRMTREAWVEEERRLAEEETRRCAYERDEEIRARDEEWERRKRKEVDDLMCLNLKSVFERDAAKRVREEKFKEHVVKTKAWLSKLPLTDDPKVAQGVGEFDKWD